MDTHIYDTFVKILESELVPALGCTEPIAIAFAAAKAREVLGQMPTAIVATCSGNIIKNVKGVTVPNSGGHKGIEVAATLGVVGGNADKELEVLSEVTPAQVEETLKLIEEGVCKCEIAEGVENLYVLIEVSCDNGSASVEITESHANITKILKDGEVIFKKEISADRASFASEKALLNVKDILEFADTVVLEDVSPVIKRQIALNYAIAEEGLKDNWGAEVGRTILKYYDDTDVRVRAKALAAAGSDARMNGCALPVVINSGSGNQGITVSVPVIEYAKEWNKTEEELIRALVVANLIALLQKSYIGGLSAYCGAVSAGTGAASGIAYLDGQRYDVISKTIINTLANVGGIVCDGAKSSCAAKISSSVDAGLLGYQMAQDEKVFQSGDGLVKQTVDETIRSFGRMGKDGMKETDVEILNIMIEL